MKLLLLRRLSFRLAFKQTLTFALLVIVIAWSAYALLARRIFGQVDEELQDRSIAVRSMLQVRSNDIRWLNDKADPEVRAQFDKSIRFYQLLDDTGKVIEGSREMAELRLPFDGPRMALQSGHNSWEYYGAPGENHLRILNTPVLGPRQQQYVLRIGVSLAEADEDCRRLRLFMLLLLPFMVLAHAINAWAMADASLSRLEKITTAAKQITPFDLSSRLPVSHRHDELDELSISLNATIARLQSSFQRMTEFLRNLSHEIRQPLTVLRSETEQALRMGNSEINYRDTLSKQLEHVELLARTVSDLMELAQSEHEQIKLQLEKEDLSELVQAALDGMRMQASERSIQISGAVQQNVVGAFDAGQIWRLLLNLLDNAIKFNRAGGKIDVSLSVVNGMAMVSIADTGSGIAADEQARVFERGYRTAAARKSSVPGTGLGLHFARAIAEAHGGHIEVASTPGEGSCFRVCLPLLAVKEPSISSSTQRDATVN
ncbi:MAG TPA: ATP-binding protein [Candidatus Angelobacter sp.]|jgi:signal transduction histidine kinase